VRVVQPGSELDFAYEAVRRNADEQLGVKDLEGDGPAAGIAGQEDPRVPSFPDFAVHVILPCKGLAHQRQHVAPDQPLLERGI
jgi:hypothetical protein